MRDWIDEIRHRNIAKQDPVCVLSQAFEQAYTGLLSIRDKPLGEGGPEASWEAVGVLRDRAGRHIRYIHDTLAGRNPSLDGVVNKDLHYKALEDRVSRLEDELKALRTQLFVVIQQNIRLIGEGLSDDPDKENGE